MKARETRGLFYRPAPGRPKAGEANRMEAAPAQPNSRYPLSRKGGQGESLYRRTECIRLAAAASSSAAPRLWATASPSG